ncbi:hypothetical protein D3C76_1500500 [compost metagenome]
MKHEQQQPDQCTTEQAGNLCRIPGLALADQGDAQQQAAQAENQQGGAEVIDLRFVRWYLQAAQGTARHPPGGQAQGQVEPEHPAP